MDAMDCHIVNKHDIPEITETCPNVSSPEMFGSDTESDVNEKTANEISNDISTVINFEKPSQAELITKSDGYLLVRINKFLSGVPPPPNRTICQSDCSDFLQHIYKNRNFFWTGYPLSNKNLESKENAKSLKDITTEVSNENVSYRYTKDASKNLINAFDNCDSSANSTKLDINSNSNDSDNSSKQQNVLENMKNSINVDKQTMSVSSVAKFLPTQIGLSNNTRKQIASNIFQGRSPILYHTVNEKEAITLTWPQAYSHKFHGIHYNRSRAIEEFENLTVKLCERYIGEETQSTCNIWFTKQPVASGKKRHLVTKYENGQSPGKRLTHLTKRRKIFSSANLQGLKLTDKKRLMLQIKKPIYKKGKSPKGKSPRGKSPRGKSPRGKSPRSSAKKKVVRRLILEGPSPRKSHLETSKRALFQSPPLDHAGPSKSLGTGNTDTQRIKRALFPTPTKKENESEVIKQAFLEESRKRKCEEELQGPRFKWAKSLSFNCTHELQNTSKVAWDRHSSSNVLSKNSTSFNQGTNELSDTHRKKLLWAVAEALRSKGIGMSHPKFKQYAANLARTIKKFMPDLENRNIPRKPGSTSDRMLKLAKHHVLFLLNPRPTD